MEVEAKLSKAKIMGGAGAVILLIAQVALIGLGSQLLAILGLVFILFAVKNISEALRDRSIFRNMLYSVVVGVVGSVLFYAVVVITLLPSVVKEMMSNEVFAPGLIGQKFTKVLGVLVGVFLILWVTSIISAVFLRRSFNTIADRLNAKIFSVTALLYLIGAVLLIVFFIGYFVFLIACILMAIAFFSLPTKLPEK